MNMKDINYGSKENKEDTFDWKRAAKRASSCEHFKEDAEDECIADDAVSCYNCRYRRWVADDYICMKK